MWSTLSPWLVSSFVFAYIINEMSTSVMRWSRCISPGRQQERMAVPQLWICQHVNAVVGQFFGLKVLGLVPPLCSLWAQFLSHVLIIFTWNVSQSFKASGQCSLDLTLYPPVDNKKELTSLPPLTALTYWWSLTSSQLFPYYWIFTVERVHKEHASREVDL